MDVRKIYMPYCLKRQEDGRWLILNRKYKPVGFNTDKHITYEDFPVSVKLKGLRKETLKKLSWNGNIDGECIYLYDDGTAPTARKDLMDAYLEKLRILMRLTAY